MGRKGGDHPAIASSSIALLQERFRQLQKVREEREGKELLKLVAESNSVSPTTMNYERNRLPFQQPQPEVVIRPCKQPPMDDFRGMSMTVPASAASTSLWPNNAASSSTSTSFENSDVDTSLHL